MTLNYPQKKELAARHNPPFRDCPTIIDSNKKVLKRKQINHLNQKRRNSSIIESNC